MDRNQLQEAKAEWYKSHPGLNVCDELFRMVKDGHVIIERENVDEKGLDYTYSLRFVKVFGGTVSFKYCPWCGEHVFNLLTSTSKGANGRKCLNPDHPDNKLHEPYPRDEFIPEPPHPDDTVEPEPYEGADDPEHPVK